MNFSSDTAAQRPPIRSARGGARGLDLRARLRAHGLARRNSRQWTGGFTLIELLVVVVIITVFAALAIPSISARMKDRRAREAALRVAGMYQQARLRAMGRGTAVLVRFTPGASGRGRFEMLEAQTGTPGCTALPVPSCRAPDWNDSGDPKHRLVTFFDVENRGEYDLVKTTMQDQSGSTTSDLDICFTPMGRAYAREALGTPFTQLAKVYNAKVERVVGPAALRPYRNRNVVILPSGIARLQ